MLVACQFVVTQGGPSLLRPADVPGNYKTSDAIARHKERARQSVIDDAAETAACLQPVGALVMDEKTGSIQRPTGAIAPWLMGVLYDPIIQRQTVWTMFPKVLGRVVALSCLRMGIPQVPDWLFLGDRFRDPFRVLFGTGRFDRSACLRNLGVNDPSDNTLEEQIRVLHQLSAKIDSTGAIADRSLEYGEDRHPSWGGGHG